MYSKKKFLSCFYFDDDGDDDDDEDDDVSMIVMTYTRGNKIPLYLLGINFPIT